MKLAVRSSSFSAFSKMKRWISSEGSNSVFGKWMRDGSITSIAAKSQEQRKRTSIITPALPETAASLAIAVTVVGTATTLLVQRNKASKETQVPLKTCEECGGSGICSECKGEGFVLKRMTEESAEKARLASKNMATRYTAGLPKKWSYCTKCSSSRSCITCGGRGQLNV